MKVVGKIIKVALLILLFNTSGIGQNSLIVKKKYNLMDTNGIFLSDSTLTSYKVQMPKVYDFNNLALFCKVEEKVAQKSKVNMRFRLGSLDYVNYLEQKPSWQLTKN